MDKTMALKPRISEKAYGMSQQGAVYVFQVPTSASKLTIAGAVSAQFDVTVMNVNVINVKGKTRRTVKKGGRQTFGKLPNIKKAYVTLKSGDSIAIFANEDDDKSVAKGKKK